MTSGFRMAIGRQGSGKTILITKLAIDNYTGERPIFSNYTLKQVPYTPVVLDFIEGHTYKKGTISIMETLENDPNYFNDSIILLDEIHIYFDSLDFMRNNNRKAQTFFSQLRKRNILLFATTQYFMNVDIRIRRQCFNVFEMEHIYKDLFKVITLEVDGYFSKEVSEYHINLKDYYDHYDTNELVLD